MRDHFQSAAKTTTLLWCDLYRHAQLKGANILMSVILYPEFLKAENQFFLSMVFSLAILKTVEKYSKGNCKIKWPNDIYLNEKKNIRFTYSEYFKEK